MIPALQFGGRGSTGPGDLQLEHQPPSAEGALISKPASTGTDGGPKQNEPAAFSEFTAQRKFFH